MATVAITIEGVRHEVDDRRNLLDICLSLGYDVPYFCWHPALGSIGACRQCAVKLYWDDDDQKGEIVMACLTQPRAGNRVAIQRALAQRRQTELAVAKRRQRRDPIGVEALLRFGERFPF